ncbi:MAG: bifunctional 3-(3-hydroxy-phenyl)propionate/3-hydroxycinnamic acid hydroxylase [Phycicoccus sp.]|nr:bifunctional 3-(3-hydroxy-phenyl)propionate/3-hydroxycinnamic acid hydroxylase [Phycicoccus sp.]
MNAAPIPAGTPADPFPVVIVGAGPAGVTAATLLGQYGIQVLVLDRWEGVYPQPRAVHLDDEVYRILARMGVGAAFAEMTRPTLGLQLVDRDHQVLATFRREGDEGQHGYPRANMFDQPELEQLLRNNLETQATITLRGNVNVTAITQDGDSPVRVDFTDRTTGAPQTVHGVYLLGCDGANSTVREAIGSTMRDLNFEQRWLVIDVRSDVELDQWDGVHQVCDPDRAATYMRIGSHRYRWEFQLLPGESADDYREIEALAPLLAPWVQGIPRESLELVRVAEYTFRAQLADRWRDRRVFLLGDAAHLTPPFIGQGLCAGLRDAMNLSWKLAGVIAGGLPSSVLDTYESERKPHAHAMIRLAKLIGAAMSQGGSAGNLLRGLIAPRLHLLPGLRDRILDSETPPLTRSALVARPHALRALLRPPLAGRLCPNARLDEGPRRFDDVATGRFMMVSSRQLAPADEARLAARGAGVVTAAPGSALHAWLESGHSAMAVVRPDYTVMAAGSDAASLIEAVPDLSALPA